MNSINSTTQQTAPAYESDPLFDKYEIVMEFGDGSRMVLTAPTIKDVRASLVYNVRLMGPKAAMCLSSGYTPDNMPAAFVKPHKRVLVAARGNERLFVGLNPRKVQGYKPC